MNTNLKRLMTATAVAVLFGTPAFAANHANRYDRAPQAPYAASEDGHHRYFSGEAYGYAPREIFGPEQPMIYR
jgi:hypothetical protein